MTNRVSWSYLVTSCSTKGLKQLTHPKRCMTSSGLSRPWNGHAMAMQWPCNPQFLMAGIWSCSAVGGAILKPLGEHLHFQCACFPQDMPRRSLFLVSAWHPSACTVHMVHEISPQRSTCLRVRRREVSRRIWTWISSRRPSDTSEASSPPSRHSDRDHSDSSNSRDSRDSCDSCDHLPPPSEAQQKIRIAGQSPRVPTELTDIHSIHSIHLAEATCFTIEFLLASAIFSVFACLSLSFHCTIVMIRTWPKTWVIACHLDASRSFGVGEFSQRFHEISDVYRCL